MSSLDRWLTPFIKPDSIATTATSATFHRQTPDVATPSVTHATPENVQTRPSQRNVAKVADVAVVASDIAKAQARYYELCVQHEASGHSRNESEWRAINETFLALCEGSGIDWRSDEGYRLMRILIATTGFNPVPCDTL